MVSASGLGSGLGQKHVLPHCNSNGRFTSKSGLAWRMSVMTRAVGHAGAMAGSGDKAEDKENWFMESFGVDAIFTPENPVVSAKGAVVSNIAHIPLALTAVMKLNNVRPDFEPRGSLALKPWIANDQGIELPPQLALRPVEATPPYGAQIKALSRQIGAVIPRQNMKDKSGATVMDAKTQVTSVHGRSVLELALLPLEANFALPLVHEIAGENDRAMLDIAVAAETNLVGDPALMAAEAAREAGNSPNTVMAAAAAIVGPKRVERTLSCARRLIDLFAHSGLLDARDEGFDLRSIKVDENTRALFSATAAEANDPRPEAMLKAMRDRGGKSLFLKFLESLGARPSRDAILAAIATTIAWGPLMRKRISRLTAETLPWYLRLYGVMIGASIPAKHHQHGSLCGISREERFSRWNMADVLFLALTGKKPSEAEARPLQILIGLLISNGPGSISAQGAKGAVAADGPQLLPAFRSTKPWSAFSPTAVTATAATVSREWPSCWSSSRMPTCGIPRTAITASTSRPWRLRSGEYLGKYRRLAPTAWIASSTPATLWKGTLSTTTTSLRLSVGTKHCSM